MADHQVRFYDSNPASILTTSIGSTFEWTGSDYPVGFATITDNEAGTQGATLDDNGPGGETATADVSIGGATSTASGVEADMVWTIRDTLTNETFEVVQFRVMIGDAAGFYTLSEIPLVAGRTYEVEAYDNAPDVTSGDPAFTYGDYVAAPNLVTGTSGADTIDNTYSGDPQDDKVDDGWGGGATGDDNVVDGMDGTDSISSGAGDDTVYGGAGEDTLDGGTGDDSLTGGTGDDSLTGGTGDDVYVFADGSGADTITDFDTGDDDLDGFYNDQFDVSGLTDAQANPVNVHDVTVSDDGSGNALFDLSNGETIVLQGVTPAQMDNAALMAAGIPCFTKGTLILTPDGERPIEQLRAGDQVVTLDHGPRALLWIGKRSFGPAELARDTRQKPVLIAARALDNHHDLLVSPLHGVLIRQPDGTGEFLVRAKHLAGIRPGIRIAHGKRHVTYFHLLFPAHQVVRANGAWCESLYPGPFALAVFGAEQREQVYRLLPNLKKQPTERAYGSRARRFLARREVSETALDQAS